MTKQAHAPSRQGARLVRAALSVFFLLAVTGCATDVVDYPMVSQPGKVDRPVETKDANLVTRAYSAADAMLGRLKEPLDTYHAIAPATFVNLNNLEETTSLGRLISRQMASRFTQHGYAMTEVKLRKNMVIRKNQGEFLLTRELQKIGKSHKVQAVLVGNYAPARDIIFVSAQLIRVKDNLVLAAHDFTLPMGPNVKSLMGIVDPRDSPPTTLGVIR